MDQDATWYGGIELGPGDIVYRRRPSSPSRKGGAQQFAHNFRSMYCGQTSGWIKVPLGTEVALGPGHIVLDADQPLPKRAKPPNFRPMSVVAKLLG